ncbi:MAG: UvrD-helicase domain-containing protein [Planctomycetes bacterium]|nr:UvrD-helicase domain-containing protein [Planctomycetota bacterium]
MSDPLADLTPAQHAAVTHTQGPLLVIAGAGSGKTRVITRRVAHLLRTGVQPHHVLAITFTNKAAQEMRERIAELTGGAKVWVSTFHAFCARTLRRYAEQLGFPRSFTIVDNADQRTAVHEALLETKHDPKQYGIPRVLQQIGRYKDMLLSPDQARAEACTPFEHVAVDAYAYYQDLLTQNAALDFGDLLHKTVTLLEDEDTRDSLSTRHRYLLIDEYQDTNHAQYKVTQLLAQSHRNICATGDPNQAIYGWRGADIRNILEFERDYPEAKVVHLEENFRSTQTILDAANGLIAHNTERREHTLRCTQGEGDPIVLQACDSERQEASWVAERIQGRLRSGVPRSEIGVFYRTNALSRALEVELIRRGLPFEVIGATPFYQRKEIKDLLSYLRLVHNPNDDLAAIRVLNVPPRGLGKTSLGRLKTYARERDLSLVAAAREAPAEATRGRARKGLAAFCALLDELREEAEAELVAPVLRAIVRGTSYYDYLAKEYPEEEDRALNVESLIGGARDWDVASHDARLRALAARAGEALPELFRSVANAGPGGEEEGWGLGGFLEHAALVAERADDGAPDEERLSLMTVHAAKGLEFDSVFVLGLEEGLFPHSRSTDDPTGLEEERRLAYVAITRAKRRLHLSYARWRAWHGRSSSQEPSLFLYELPQEAFPAGASLRDLQRAGGARRSVHDAFDGVDEPPEEPYWQRPLGAPLQAAGATRSAPAPASPPRMCFPPLTPLPARKPDAPVATALKSGDRVYHEQFGPGEVLDVRGEQLRTRARVKFRDHGTKDLVLQYARLTKRAP